MKTGLIKMATLALYVWSVERLRNWTNELKNKQAEIDKLAIGASADDQLRIEQLIRETETDVKFLKFARSILGDSN